MAADERWYFTKEEIDNSPSRKCGIDAEKELSYRQQGAKLIQDMGQRLQVNQLAINTAIVYMHRFYMYHPFTRFHRHSIAPAALFLAAKVEEQPRKLEHVIKASHYFLCHDQPCPDTQSDAYLEKAQELVMNENILLQTLGFDVAIDHPHTYVVKCFQMVRASTDLPQTSYFMATNSLHMTTMCLQYKPAVVACVCIDIVCKWSNYEIQRFTEGKDWFVHVDPSVTVEMLETLTTEFIAVLDKFPSRLKKLMNSAPHGGASGSGMDYRRHSGSMPMNIRSPYIGSGPPIRNHEVSQKGGSSKGALPSHAPSKTVLSHKEYNEKREKERRDRERERAEHRERHSHHASANPASTSVHPSAGNAVPSSHSHSRRALTDQMRMPPPQGVPNKVPNVIPHRETIQRREHTSLHVDKYDRTSENHIDNSKVLDRIKSQSVDSKHPHSAEHIINKISYDKEKKVDSKLDVKCEPKDIKSEPRDVLLPLDIKSGSKEVKSEYKPFDSKLQVPKTEIKPKIKSDNVESKEEVQTDSKEDLKSNSFIFTNNDYSTTNFLNPSETIPENIFDTETESKPTLAASDFLLPTTTHHKPNSPKQLPPTNVNVVPTPVSSSSNHKSVVRNAASELHNSSRTASDPKKQSNSNINSHSTPNSDKLSHGNGLPHTSSHFKNIAHKKEKETKVSPVLAQFNRVKHSNVIDSTTPPLSSKSEHKHRNTKDSSTAQLPVPAQNRVSANPPLVTTSVQSSKLTPVGRDTPPIINAAKVCHETVEHSAVSVMPTTTEAGHHVSASNHSSKKKKKSDHNSHHKHKEKKKHRSKEKDKRKEKECKDHKKEKKHKHREKDKHKEKERPHNTPPTREDTAPAALPLKIKICREKGVYTPESGHAVSHTPTTTVSTSSSSISPLNTPGSLKLTIQKSRIQSDNIPSSHIDSSPSMSLPAKDMTTPKVKLKISKEKLEKESRKRDRSPGDGHQQSNKLPRNSTSLNLQQVLDSARWSSQKH